MNIKRNAKTKKRGNNNNNNNNDFDKTIIELNKIKIKFNKIRIMNVLFVCMYMCIMNKRK